MASNGIICLEGDWDMDLRKRRSVRPILELLERLGEIKAIHKDVATVGEAEHYIKRWAENRYNDYPVLYIATHGTKGIVNWSGREQSSLDELAEMLSVVPKDFYVYFGSCQTLFDNAAVSRFVERSGASAVLGYRREVDWIETAAFDVILLPQMANHTGRPQTMFNNLMARHGELARLLKFVVGTKSTVLRAQDYPHS